jgi:hypothetical protein
MTPEQQKQLLVRILERIAIKLGELGMSSNLYVGHAGMSTSGVADIQDDIRKYEEEASA